LDNSWRCRRAIDDLGHEVIHININRRGGGACNQLFHGTLFLFEAANRQLAEQALAAISYPV
jgi:hypothetical protein